MLQKQQPYNLRMQHQQTSSCVQPRQQPSASRHPQLMQQQQHESAVRCSLLGCPLRQLLLVLGAVVVWVVTAVVAELGMMLALVVTVVVKLMLPHQPHHHQH
jgi:Flp pilus assembly protein TadB